MAVYSKPDSAQELNSVFQRELKLHPTDALIWARHVPGILSSAFSADQARALVTAIHQIGVRSSAIPATDIPDLHHAAHVHHARCTDSGLQIVTINSEQEFVVPWSAIELICLGEVPVETNRHYSTGIWSGVSAGHHYQSSGVTVPGTPSLEAWIVCRQPHPVLCIDHGRMNYEYLGARRVDSATCNFQQFITDLTDKATSARLTESTVCYLRHIDPEKYRYSTRDDLLRHATLQTLMNRESAAASPLPPT